MENAKFVISLDFELHWGVYDALGNEYNKNILGARKAIPKILELFDKYKIHATWATVGMLFCKDIDDFNKYKPKKLPIYKNESLNPYNIEIGKSENEDKLHYAYSLLKLIKNCPNQEIASHSYSHYNALALGQVKEQFEDDLKSAILVAKELLDIDLKSYVFAKNEINFDYIDILKKHDIKIFRSTPNHMIYSKGQNLSLIEKAIRMLDAYINITGYYSSSIQKGNIHSTQGDRFLRPYKNTLLNKLMIKRIKKEMLYAAKNNRVYHLWWHPHNFGINLEKNLDNLRIILEYYSDLNKKYHMESKCMVELM